MLSESKIRRVVDRLLNEEGESELFYFAQTLKHSDSLRDSSLVGPQCDPSLNYDPPIPVADAKAIAFQVCNKYPQFCNWDFRGEGGQNMIDQIVFR